MIRCKKCGNEDMEWTKVVQKDGDSSKLYKCYDCGYEQIEDFTPDEIRAYNGK